MACQKETVMRVWNHNSPIVSHIQFLPTKNIYNSKTVIQYIKPPAYLTCSFRVKNVGAYKMSLSKRDCSVCLEPLLTDRISNTALTQKIYNFYSRAVIAYVIHSHTTCSFWVIHVSTHNLAYQKETVVRVWSHNSLILAHMQLYSCMKRKISDSRAVVWCVDC